MQLSCLFGLWTTAEVAEEIMGRIGAAGRPQHDGQVVGIRDFADDEICTIGRRLGIASFASRECVAFFRRHEPPIDQEPTLASRSYLPEVDDNKRSAEWRDRRHDPQ
jgi:hypothetical protein